MIDYKDKIKALVELAETKRGTNFSEEATKTSLVLPLLKILGHDIFSPKTLVPEYTSDVGLKSNERVDYAVFNDSKLLFIMEVKSLDTTLNSSHVSQLYRYFSVSDCHVAILTNGIKYSFYIDFDKQNIMDITPSYELSLDNMSNTDYLFLNYLSIEIVSKGYLHSILTKLRFMRQLNEKFTSIGDDFARWFRSHKFSDSSISFKNSVSLNDAKEVVGCYLGSLNIDLDDCNNALLSANLDGVSRRDNLVGVSEVSLTDELSTALNIDPLVSSFTPSVGIADGIPSLGSDFISNDAYITKSIAELVQSRVMRLKIHSINFQGGYSLANGWWCLVYEILQYIDRCVGADVRSLVNCDKFCSRLSFNESSLTRAGMYTYGVGDNSVPVYFEKNLSTYETIRFAVQLCNTFNINTDGIFISYSER